MAEIINHKHRFKIDNEEIVLSISCIKGYWSCKLLSGNSGVGNCSGGRYLSLNEYIKDVENEHRYAYSFFNGYKYANENTR